MRAVGLHLQRAYMGLGRDADAVGVALELSRRYPDDPEVLYHTGRIFSNYAYLQTMRLQRVAPESVWMHQAAGEANESQGFWDAAIREYEQVLAASPNRPGLHFRIGRVLLAQAGQAGSDASSLTARARQQFELELQRDPTNANAAYELGELQRRAGELEPAVASFGAAVHSDPGFSDALVGLGRTLTTLNRASEAVPLLERATTLDPNSDVAFYLLSQAYGATGNAVGQQRALETFRRLRAQKRGDGPSLGEGRPGRHQTGAAGRARRRLTAAGRGPRGKRGARGHAEQADRGCDLARECSLSVRRSANAGRNSYDEQPGHSLPPGRRPLR